MKTATPTTFPIHTLDGAPADSRETLARLKANLGMIPNLAAAMSESPTLIKAFTAVRETTLTGKLDGRIRELILLSNATLNQCRYCTAIHSVFALGGGIPADTVEAVRGGALPDDPRQRAAVKFSQLILKNKGNVTDDQLNEFFAAGFDRSHALEIIALTAQSIIANYSSHMTGAPPDEPIKAQYR
ncbi:MAG: carboxymuconolactone decarboxylase family protein [Planctomycetia bacterium]